MPCEGIIFDFNGTLIFDIHVHERAWNVLIPRIRAVPFTAQEFNDHVNGRTNREIFSYALGRDLSEEESFSLGEHKEALYRELLAEDPAACQLVPGAEAFLDLLRDHAIPMAIATAAPASNVDFYRELFGLNRWFADERIVFADGTLPGKPHPGLFNRAISRLGIPASACIIVEDSVLGVQAAHAAGAGRIIGIHADDEVRATLEGLPLYRLIPDYRGMDLTAFR